MRIRILPFFLAAAFFAGCSVPFHVRGGFKEGMPKLYDPIAEGASVWVERPEKPASQSLYQRREHMLVEEFEKAFKEHGAERPEKKEDADVVVEIEVLSWEYNDAGMSGFRERDHIELQVTLSDPGDKLILQRAMISISSDFRIIGRYVDSLYKER